MRPARAHTHTLARTRTHTRAHTHTHTHTHTCTHTAWAVASAELLLLLWLSAAIGRTNTAVRKLIAAKREGPMREGLGLLMYIAFFTFALLWLAGGWVHVFVCRRVGMGVGWGMYEGR